MTQAKGIMPRGEDRTVLYRNPRTCGYFVGITLSPGLDRPGVEAWLTQVDAAIAMLVAREEPDRGQQQGDKVAAVAVGLAPSFFTVNGAPRWSPAVEPPAGFPFGQQPSPLRSGVLASSPLVEADVLFYVASVYEARVKLFLAALDGLAGTERLTLDRGYQRADETEHFGYRDGVRNVMPRTERPESIFVHRDGRELDEPVWAEDGSYMAYMKIRQNPASPQRGAIRTGNEGGRDGLRGAISTRFRRCSSWPRQRDDPVGVELRRLSQRPQTQTMRR